METERIKKAVNTFDISLLDHIIICDDRYFSFAAPRVEIDDHHNRLDINDYCPR